ncbi:MAG: hypothetical protein WAK82_29090 [Streptosporangiaceae bacterium]
MKRRFLPGLKAGTSAPLCVMPAGGSVLNESDLIGHLVRTLPHYILSRYIEILAELPHASTNKVQRQALRAVAASPGVRDRAAAGISVRALADREQDRMRDGQRQEAS